MAVISAAPRQRMSTLKMQNPRFWRNDSAARPLIVAVLPLYRRQQQSSGRCCSVVTTTAAAGRTWPMTVWYERSAVATVSLTVRKPGRRVSLSFRMRARRLQRSAAGKAAERAG